MQNAKLKYALNTTNFIKTSLVNLLCCLFLLGATIPLQAQSANEKKEEAKLFFSNKKYRTALSLLQSSRALYRDDKESKFLIALCHYQLNELDEALAQLNRFSEEERTPYPELWLYYGRIYHARHQFDQASTYYKRYLRTIRPGHANRQMVIEDIRRCANGINLQFQEALAIVENLGKGVNTEHDEFAPMLSPNYNDRLYFSSIRPGNIGNPKRENGRTDERLGQYPSDMFNCQITNGIWGNIQPMHYLLNSPNHEILLGFNSDGNALYYFKGRNLRSGQIIVDTFKRVEERLVSSTPLQVPMNTASGDNSPFFYNDTLLFFASNRIGGYGGSDIYKTSLRNGRWSTPVNLGPDINTAYDETTPFMARDGHTLFYSSNDSKKSIGGLDVFKSFYIEGTKRWTKALNMGIPINSSADDDYFKISGDGFTAFFASARKDGAGQRDIYIAYFQSFLEEMEWPTTAYTPPSSQQQSNLPPVPDIRPEETPVVMTPPTNPTNNTGNRQPISDGFEEDFPTTTTKVPTSSSPPPSSSPYAPIYYTNAEELTRHTSKKETLDRVISQMKQQSSLVVIFSAYPNEVTATALFQLTKDLEVAGNYLHQAGIPLANIYIRAIGMPKTQRVGQCVEISFFDLASNTVSENLPVVGRNMEMVEPGLRTYTALHYKVQVASAQRSIEPPFQQGVDYVMIERKLDFPYYRYTLGAANTYTEASTLRRQLARKGFESAYVVPFVNGYRVDKKQARLKMTAFPDLRRYLHLK